MTEPPVAGDRLPAPVARDRVVDVLTRLFADDLITEADLEAGLERVYRAASGTELEAILADLPAALPATATHSRPRPVRLFSLKGSQAAGADSPSIVRVTGRATLGFAECSVASGEAPRLPGQTD